MSGERSELDDECPTYLFNSIEMKGPAGGVDRASEEKYYQKVSFQWHHMKLWAFQLHPLDPLSTIYTQ